MKLIALTGLAAILGLGLAARAETAAEFLTPPTHEEELGAGGSRLAETFTSVLDGKLSSLGLSLRPGLSNVLVELHSVSGSLPSDTVLVSGTLTPAEQLVSGLSVLDFSSANLQLSQGTAYAIVVTQATQGADAASNAAWKGSIGNPYAGGAGLESIDGGVSWFPIASSLDFNFQVGVTAHDGGTGNDIPSTPEPATVAVLALSGIALLSRRRKTA